MDVFLCLGLVLVTACLCETVSSSEYKCSGDKLVTTNETITQSVVNMSSGCNYTRTGDSGEVLLQVFSMVRNANGRDNVSVTIDDTVFEGVSLHITANTLANKPFLLCMTRSRIKIYKGIAINTLEISGTLPHRSNITLRGNTLNTVYGTIIRSSFNLTNASTLLLADNTLTMNYTESVGEGNALDVWFQPGSLTISDHSHCIWEYNTVTVTTTSEARVYWTRLGVHGPVLFGNSVFSLRGNRLEWKGGSDAILVHFGNLSANTAMMYVERNIITTSDNANLSRFLEITSSSSYTLNVCGNKKNGEVLSVGRVCNSSGVSIDYLQCIRTQTSTLAQAATCTQTHRSTLTHTTHTQTYPHTSTLTQAATHTQTPVYSSTSITVRGSSSTSTDLCSD